MTNFTVYTPTFNRAHTLVRVYDCLKKQSFKNFIWLIVDDGSTDNTKDLVETWLKEAILEIRYLYKPNGGKHTAMELAHKSVTTKYIIGLDSDDILLPYAIETFNKHWTLIEEDGLDTEIAEIRAFSIDDKEDQIVGGNLSMFKNNLNYIDSTWQQWYLKHRRGHEMIMSHNTRKLNECVSISKYKYKLDKIKYIGEGVFWSSIGRKYKTRFINYVARVYYQDGVSILRPKIKHTDRFNNHLVNSLYFVDENMQYFWYNPMYFIKSIFLFSISGLYLDDKFKNQFEEINNIHFKCLYVLLYPISYIAYIYYKYVVKLK